MPYKELPKTLPVPITSENLSDCNPLEFVFVIGYAGTGKSRAILQMAEYWEMVEPDGRVYIIDTETGLIKMFKSQFSQLKNVALWHGESVSTIERVISVFDEIAKIVTPKDWLCIESDTKIWAKSQDAAWAKITGVTKDEYLSKRLASEKSMAVTPSPDNLWQYAKDAYNRRFTDVILNDVKLRTNIMMTTGITKPSPQLMAKGGSRKDTMKLLGMDLAPDGHPENVRNPDTVIMMSREPDGYWATVLKDRSEDKPGRQVMFRIETNFWMDFIAARSGK
jgi:hypothetical protein